MGVKYMAHGPEHAAKGFSLANWIDLEKNIYIYNNNKISCKIITFLGKHTAFPGVVMAALLYSRENVWKDFQSSKSSLNY